MGQPDSFLGALSSEFMDLGEILRKPQGNLRTVFKRDLAGNGMLNDETNLRTSDHDTANRH
jgi:hypothetical protein